MAYPDHNLLVEYGGNRIVCNPYSHTHHWTGVHPSALTSRPATVRDTANAISENSTKLLDYLADECGYTPLEVKNVGATLGATESELASLQQAEDEKLIDIDELRRRVRFAGVMTDAVIELHATVSTPRYFGCFRGNLTRLAD